MSLFSMFKKRSGDNTRSEAAKGLKQSVIDAISTGEVAQLERVLGSNVGIQIDLSKTGWRNKDHKEILAAAINRVDPSMLSLLHRRGISQKAISDAAKQLYSEFVGTNDHVVCLKKAPKSDARDLAITKNQVVLQQRYTLLKCLISCNAELPDPVRDARAAKTHDDQRLWLVLGHYYAHKGEQKKGEESASYKSMAREYHALVGAELAPPQLGEGNSFVLN